MQRTGRLFELMILLNRQTKFTVQELADQFGVSRRTMLRDLQMLSEMGVPLQSSPGVHGGYTVMRAQQLPPISLSPGEAIGLMLSYESLEAYPDSPFRESHFSALTKLRSVLPQDVITEVDELRERVAIDFPIRKYEAPFLQPLLQAAKEQIHVEIEYESNSGRTRRVIFPYGLMASQGFWYCPSHCYKRRERVWFRVDRITHLQRREGYEGDAPILSLQEILHLRGEVKGSSIWLKATLTATGCKIAGPDPKLGHFVQILPDGTGCIDMEIKASDLGIFGQFLLGLGKEVHVQSPREMILYLREEASAILAQYENGSEASR